MPTELEGTYWVDEIAKMAFTGDKPGRNVVPRIAYDEPRGLLALGATTTPEDYSGLGMVYLVELDL